MAAALTDRGIPLSTLCPKFLHTNSTSHTWPFSAIAELIDNAYDPDVNAKQIWIDKTQIKDMECLTFMDNGNGLSSDMMHMMLSFGYSRHPIGMYGDGFKSGSMRLGQDAIVLSKSKNDLCVGMLSQTYLERTGAEEITVPIISIKKPEAKHFSVMEEHQASLRDILDHSPFNNEEELLTELRAIEGPTGTKIIIWNLRRTSKGKVALDFTTENDICIPCDDSDTSGTSDPESHSSLRAYCSILYLKPFMQINIRGQKVENHPIYESLEYINVSYRYKPKAVKEKIPIIFGDNTKSKEHYGLMMYHKNRLIKAYHRVGCQLKAKNWRGVGVIGVIECNHLKPTRNKQDFDNDDAYRNTIRSVASMLRDYSGKRNNPYSDNVPIEEPNMDSDAQHGVQQFYCLHNGNTIQNVASKLRDYSGKRRKETDDEMTDEDDESEETTPQTSGEGPSGNKRKWRKCRNLRSSTSRSDGNIENNRGSELFEADKSLRQEQRNLTAQLDELNSKAEQLEGEKDSISKECNQKKARLEEVQKSLDALWKK